MSELAARLQHVRTHVDGLRKDRDRLSAAKSTLEEDLRAARRNADVLQARITELERENEVLRAVRPAQGAVQHRPDPKERIDELVIEIDRCLALLKN